MYVILESNFLLDKNLSLEEKGLLAIEALSRRTGALFDTADVPCVNSVNEISHLVISIKSKGYQIKSIDEANNSEQKKTKKIEIAFAEMSEEISWKETALYRECMSYFEISGHTYPLAMYREFIEYWTVPVKGKERWIGQKKKDGNFHIARRMGTWYGKFSDFHRYECWKKSIDNIVARHESVPEKYIPRSEDFFRVLKQYGQRWDNAKYFPDNKPVFKDIREFNIERFKMSNMPISNYIVSVHGPAPDPKKDIEGYNIYMERMNTGKV